jgi:hypothetical protein
MPDPESTPLLSDDGPVMFASPIFEGRSARWARKPPHGAYHLVAFAPPLAGPFVRGVCLETYTWRGLPTRGASMATNCETRIGIAINCYLPPSEVRASAPLVRASRAALLGWSRMALLGEEIGNVYVPLFTRACARRCDAPFVLGRSVDSEDFESCSPSSSGGFGHNPGQALLRRRQGGELRYSPPRVGKQKRKARRHRQPGRAL